ncbi:S8 family serine peptidase [Thiofilum flexile]|uniref:S8 family serine peptidase n=1 Tax=Thiofilum flexile TaxID=125627 RepID=UPI0003600D1C|nr:S8 family serine peptidase [Thiofilum flexile]
MKYIQTGLICCLVLLSACASTDGTRYAAVKTVQTNPACHISSAWCVGNYAYHPIRPTHYVKDEVLLVYDRRVDGRAAEHLLKTYKLRPKNRALLASAGLNLITANTGGQDPLELKKAINYAQKSIKAQTNNYYYTGSIPTPLVTSTGYPFSLTGVEAAYPFTKGKGVKIGMVDTSVDIFHESLRGKDITWPDSMKNDPRASQHGTEIAGTIISNNPKVGIAPEASLYVAPAFGKSDNKGTAADIAKAIEDCIREKVDILNLSFAGERDELVDTMVEQALRNKIIVVASAGNNGPEAKPVYPAALPGVIAVTAIDNKEQIFSRANRGSYIDLAAPGVGIFTTAPQSSYKLATGTSIATAHVSGLIALLLSMKREGLLKKDFTPDILTKSAIDLGQNGRDNDYGYGLVNLNNALQKLK